MKSTVEGDAWLMGRDHGVIRRPTRRAAFHLISFPRGIRSRSKCRLESVKWNTSVKRNKSVCDLDTVPYSANGLWILRPSICRPRLRSYRCVSIQPLRVRSLTNVLTCEMCTRAVHARSRMSRSNPSSRRSPFWVSGWLFFRSRIAVGAKLEG